MNNFMLRLKELRADKGLKQSEISELLKVTESTYSNWEQGRREPDIDSIIALAKYFNVTAGQLLGTEEL